MHLVLISQTVLSRHLAISRREKDSIYLFADPDSRIQGRFVGAATRSSGFKPPLLVASRTVSSVQRAFAVFNGALRRSLAV